MFYIQHCAHINKLNLLFGMFLIFGFWTRKSVAGDGDVRETMTRKNNAEIESVE